MLDPRRFRAWVDYYPARATDLYRAGGVAALLDGAREFRDYQYRRLTAWFFGLSDDPCRHVRRHVAIARRVFPWRYTDAEPFALYRVDPHEVDRTVVRGPYQWARVVGGEWETIPVEETPQYRALERRFEGDADWEETDLFERYVERIDRGKRAWGCDSRSELRERFARLDEIYADVAAGGYRTQAELAADASEERPARDNNDAVCTAMNEIGVAVDRDGSLVQSKCGFHRLVIARLLGLEAVPVQIRTRHREWQALREEVRAADGVADLPDRARRHRAHPDLQDVLPEAVRTTRSSPSS